MKNLLTILRATSIVILVLGLVVLVFFHIEVISMIYKEGYKTYCQSPEQIRFALQGRLIIMAPIAVGAIGWLVTENILKRRRVSR